MAGFVSRRANWDCFEREWRALLPLGLASFHMTDFVSSRRGWEPWRSGHSEDRAKLAEALVACIRRNTNQGFAVSLRMSDYMRFNTEYCLGEAIGGPYSAVGLACLGELLKWAERQDVDHTKIRCVFENGDGGQGALMCRGRMDDIDIGTESKADIRAFDSCDFAAWKTRTVVHDTVVKGRHLKDLVSAERIERSMDQLDPILQLNARIAPEVLSELCDIVGIRRRE
jgi:hypothetical protein